MEKVIYGQAKEGISGGTMAGIALTALSTGLAVKFGIDYKHARDAYLASPAGKEARAWEGAKGNLANAKRGLEDYTYTDTEVGVGSGGIGIGLQSGGVGIQLGKDVPLVMVSKHHAPSPEEASRYLEAARSALAGSSYSGKGETLSKIADMQKELAASGNYEQLRSRIEPIIRESERIAGGYQQQVHGIVQQMNATLAQTALAGTAATVSGLATAIKAKKKSELWLSESKQFLKQF